MLDDSEAPEAPDVTPRADKPDFLTEKRFDEFELPPEVMAQAIEQVLHRHFANWADETIAALGGLTPRQAITTPSGLERVKGLLREYEDGEQRQSAAQGRPAVSYQFLWDALGISR